MGKAKKGYRTEFARIAKRNSITIERGRRGVIDEALGIIVSRRKKNL